MQAFFVDTFRFFRYSRFMETFDREYVVGQLKSKIAGMTIRRAASEVGVSHTFLADILKGVRWPGQKVLAYVGMEEVPKPKALYPPRFYRKAEQ